MLKNKVFGLESGPALVNTDGRIYRACIDDRLIRGSGLSASRSISPRTGHADTTARLTERGLTSRPRAKSRKKPWRMPSQRRCFDRRLWGLTAEPILLWRGPAPG